MKHLFLSVGQLLLNIPVVLPCRQSVRSFRTSSATQDLLHLLVDGGLPGVNLTFQSDSKRQAILDSWPTVLDDSHARRDWGWEHEFDLAAMSDDIVPKIRALIEQGQAEGAHV